MTYVSCKISHEYEEDSEGNEIVHTCATCTRCYHQTTVEGKSKESVEQCLALLSKECPLKENNLYVDGRES
ncbi:MAG: hypothetical protein ABIH39_02120 [Candidatus Margulisiibacteriota bacterium]